MRDDMSDFDADQEKLDRQWAEVEKAAAGADRAFADLERAEAAERAARNNSTPPRRQYTPEEMEKGKEMLGKVAEVGIKSVATVAAVAGAGVVSIFKRDTSPLGSTFDWCKKNFWGSK